MGQHVQTTDGAPEDAGSLTLFESTATLEFPTDPGKNARTEPAPLDTPPASLHTPLASELRPRERLHEAGPEALSGSELLAILLGGEPGRALKLAAAVISGRGGLAGLRSASHHDLVDECDLSEARATMILAAVELSKRLASARVPERPVISSPPDVDAMLGARMRDLDREHFVVVLLDTRNHVLAAPTVSVGTLSSSLVHPREVFKPAIKASAASVVLAHNHPSSSLTPSNEDRAITRKLVEAGKQIQIEVLDHVIFAGGGAAGDGFFSLKEHQML